MEKKYNSNWTDFRYQQFHSSVSQLPGYADIHLTQLLRHSCLLKTGCSDWKRLLVPLCYFKRCNFTFHQDANYEAIRFHFEENRTFPCLPFWNFAEDIHQRKQSFHQRERRLECTDWLVAFSSANRFTFWRYCVLISQKVKKDMKQTHILTT